MNPIALGGLAYSLDEDGTYLSDADGFYLVIDDPTAIADPVVPAGWLNLTQPAGIWANSTPSGGTWAAAPTPSGAWTPRPDASGTWSPA